MLNVEMRTIIALLAILTALPCSMCSIPIYVLQEGPDEACGELIYSETGIILHSHPTAGRSVNTSEYLPDQSCNVTVQVQQGNFILALFTFLDLEDSNCTEDKVIFTELGKSENGSNTTVCSKSILEFQTEKIQVQFQTNSETQGKGFELLITSFSRDANCTGYRCDVDRCIADELKNDGYKQCADGTDELQSSVSQKTDLKTQFSDEFTPTVGPTADLNKDSYTQFADELKAFVSQTAEPNNESYTQFANGSDELKHSVNPTAELNKDSFTQFADDFKTSVSQTAELKNESYAQFANGTEELNPSVGPTAELKNDSNTRFADGTDTLKPSTSGTTVRPHVVKYLILFGAIVVSGIVLVSFILVLTLKITREGASCHCKNCSSNHSDDDIDDDISEIPTPPLPSETKLVTRKESKMATKHAQSTSIVSKEKPTSAQRKPSNPVVHKPSPRIKKIRVVPTLDSEW